MSTELESFFKKQGLRPMGTLVHFGIKGMRWGIRRSDAQLAANPDSVDAVRAKETLNTIRTTGKLSSVSDSDLNHLVNRINLEKRYSEVSPSTFDKGHKQIKTLLNVGDTMNKAITFANSPAGKLLGSSLGLFAKSKGKHAKL